MVDVFGLDPQGGAGHADLGQARADRLLAGDERGTASGAALLAIKIREHRALAGDAVHVRRAIAHEAVVVAAQIEPPDVVGHDEENVRLVALCHVSPPVRLVTPTRSDYAPTGGALIRLLHSRAVQHESSSPRHCRQSIRPVENRTLRAIEPHRQIESVCRRRQPVRLFVRAGVLVLDVDRD